MMTMHVLVIFIDYMHTDYEIEKERRREREYSITMYARNRFI